MRVVIHAGTHKTASTYLQHVLVLNQAALNRQDIYAQPDARLTGNHGTAWMVLADDYRHIEAHVGEAMRRGYGSAILSSEDFETLVFDHPRARLVEAAARRAGATSIEWAFCLRDPGDYFASMIAQLSRLTFVDYSGALATGLRDGRYRAARERPRYPYYWDFCLDYEAHLTAFARAIGGTVAVHDFRDAAPFPGHGIITSLGVDAASLQLPGASSRNVRTPAAEVQHNRVAQLVAILEPSGMSDGAIEALAPLAGFPEAAHLEAIDAIRRRFRPGMERLLGTRVVPRTVEGTAAKT